jgi:hypothetical protein
MYYGVVRAVIPMAITAAEAVLLLIIGIIRS